VVAEEDAVVLGAEPDHRRGDALELLGCAFAGEELAGPAS